MPPTFLPALRGKALSPARLGMQEKAIFPLAFAQYYDAIASNGGLHQRAKDWPVERAVVEGYERIIWVYKGVNAKAADSARLPYRLRQGDEVLDDHPMYRLLNKKANPLEPGPVFRKRLSAQIELSKRGAFVEYTYSNAGTPIRLDLLPPDRTEIIPGKGDDPIDHFRLTRRNGSYKNIDPENVRWFRDPHPLDPYSGTTPLEAAGLSIELDFFARLYNVTFMQNDGRPGGVLAVRKTDGSGGDIDPVQMDRIESKFDKGPTEAGKLSVIAGDLSYVDLATRPRDMQYGQTSRNSKIEVLSALGVPESVLGYAAERTFDNADAELYNYWTRTMPTHNEILLTGFDEDSDDDLEGFFDTSSIEVLERHAQKQREEARTEVAAGLRSIKSYVDLAGYGDEVEDTVHTRSLYIPSGKTPLPSKAADVEALGLGTPIDDQGNPTGGAPGAPGPGDAAAPDAPDGAAPGAPDTGQAPTGAGGDAPTPPATDGAAPAPSGAARAALDALAAANGSTKAGGARPKARAEYRYERKSGPEDLERVHETDADTADAVERALARALAEIAGRWVERAAARVESPKQRKHTRHWVSQYDHDTRVGTKALDAAKAVDENTWQQEAEATAFPIVEAAATAAAVALLTDMAVTPPPGLTLAAWAGRMVAQTVTDVVSYIGRSAAFQAGALTRAINIADQQGDSLPDIVKATRARLDRMKGWAHGIAVQAATAVSNAAADDAAREAPDLAVNREWVSRRDELVRGTHAPGTGADGQVRGVDEPFIVGTALLMQPGDIDGPLRETANCRCRLRYRGIRTGRFAPAPEIKRRPSDWDPLDHPRDRRGRFIEVGAIVSILGGGTGVVEKNVGNNRIEVLRSDGQHVLVHRNYLTVLTRPNGEKPSADADHGDLPAAAPVEDPSEDAIPEAGKDTPPGGPGRLAEVAAAASVAGALAADNAKPVDSGTAGRATPAAEETPVTTTHPYTTEHGAPLPVTVPHKPPVDPDELAYWLVVPCGGSKLDHAAPARDMYTGQAAQHSLRAAESEAAATWRDLGVDTRVLIMSARYGLTDPDSVIEPYEQEIGKPGAITPDALRDTAELAGITTAHEVFAMLPSGDRTPYLPRLQQALGGDIAISNVYEAAPGIGYQRGVASSLLRSVDVPMGDDDGEFLSAVELGLRGRPDGTGSLDDPIDVQGDTELAAKLIGEGKHIRLNRVDEVGTLLDKLAALVAEAEAAGDKAPLYDLCLVSVPKTNLFCGQNKGIPRAQMPQLSGWPMPGSIAAEHLPKNRRGGANAIPAFLAALEARGIAVTDAQIPASWLKATQMQLNGAQVAKIAAGMRDGSYPNGSIFVTRDGYVLDGHHRWAANVGNDALDGNLGDVLQDVRMLDMEIGEALDFANEFSRLLGIQQEALGEGDGPKPVAAPSPVSRTYRTTPTGANEAAYAAEIAADSGREPGFTVEGRNVVVTDPRQAAYEIEGMRDIHSDNTQDAYDAADRRKAQRAADALSKLIDDIRADG